MGGRGRGMAAFSFRVENLGITRGNMPDARGGPKALYPILEFKPVPLEPSHGDDYMLALKQEIRGTMRRLPCYLKANAAKSGVEKYKDKYANELKKNQEEQWTPDWERLPKELMPRKNLPKKKSELKKKPPKLTSLEKDSVLSRLNELEKTDNVIADEEKEEKEKEEKKKATEGDEEEGEEIEGEELEDEELEEENDYINNYFEDGDDFGAGSDDNIDEATY
ncbi:DNA-directed RNA polymerase III subunit RPC7 isoform X2 [Clupea harengus]|uniref:DNA-directed RNA polymerase III subunit RPC7 isoform X2 n=1 Tax=Clupea harengus TaxID=7950 RepID=A0A6P3VYF6_CLUHA|nr:DNA-directed RNA polymerase III subunit RPC7 isoform X2 [Clupea harengus]